MVVSSAGGTPDGAADPLSVDPPPADTPGPGATSAASPRAPLARRLRHQPPVYSPVSGRWIWDAAARLALPAADPRPPLLERLLREYDAASGVLCGGGTQALRLALGLARASTGASTAALPAFTCNDVATAAIGADVDVALYDLDPDTLAPDPDSLERALRAGAGIVVASPLYGVPLDWSALEVLADRYGAVLIEDAAQGHGASWRGTRLGALGALAILSFGRGKGWTGVRGGALLIRRRAAIGHAVEGPPEAGLAAEARVVLGAVAQWALGRPALYGLPRSIPGLHLGETRYREPEPPWRITRAAAAMVERSRSDAEAEARARRRNARRLLDGLRSARHARPVRVPEDAVPGYLRLPLRIGRGFAGLDDPAEALRHGIAPSYPAPLSRLPRLRARLAAPVGRLPGAETLARELITLPTHSRLTAEDQQRVLQQLDSTPG